MRIAYVGLSGPLCYDYKSPASKAPSDMKSSPNPILESPFGLLLLFDEIWFLCRSLCPENMRHLPYVKFLDETGALPKTDDMNLDEVSKRILDDHRFHQLMTRIEDAFSQIIVNE